LEYFVCSTCRHVGDLGNIEEDVFGDVSQTKEDRIIKFEGPADIIGRAIVVCTSNCYIVPLFALTNVIESFLLPHGWLWVLNLLYLF
jgi:hypothetical protein